MVCQNSKLAKKVRFGNINNFIEFIFAKKYSFPYNNTEYSFDKIIIDILNFFLRTQKFYLSVLSFSYLWFWNCQQVSNSCWTRHIIIVVATSCNTLFEKKETSEVVTGLFLSLTLTPNPCNVQRISWLINAEHALLTTYLRIIVNVFLLFIDGVLWCLSANCSICT